MTRPWVTRWALLLAFAASIPVRAEPVPDAAYHPECDAGDEAWVRRVVPALLGRQPFGVREVKVLTDLVKQVGREKAASILMKDAAFDQRWVSFLIDDVRVERSGRRNQEDCYGQAARKQVKPELAAFLRDSPPSAKAPGGPFTMADVVQSTVKLDDLSPFFRAHLFAMLMRPLHHCPNLTALENDENSRRAFGAAFSAVYLHRNIACAECHTDLHSPTLSKDPEKSRFWPVPGRFNEALWGAEHGRPPDESLLSFRGLGVVAFNLDDARAKRPPEEVHPWGIIPACGSLKPSALVDEDPKGLKGYLGRALDTRTSVWELESDLMTGIKALRKGEGPFGDAEGKLTGQQALASLLSQSIVQDVWTEIIGSPLTVAHGYARNQAQRDLLVGLTKTFVSSQWSLQTLLRAVVLHPLFNQKAPSEKCLAKAYPFPAVMDPWAYNEENPDRRGNSVGDLISRGTGRALLQSVSAALEWPEAPAFPSGDDATFQVNVGAWIGREWPGVSDPTFQGLLAWEDALGRCEAPVKKVKHDVLDLSLSRTQCLGRCDQSADDTVIGGHCSCDPGCELMGDCCTDYKTLCVLPPSERPKDWIDRLVSAAKDWPKAHADEKATVRDLVAAMRDRLWNDPTPDAQEEALLHDLFGAPSLDVPFETVPRAEAQLRLYCGVLLKSPQFQLRGLPVMASAGQAPRLIVAGSDYVERCRAFAPAVKAATGEALKCAADTLSLGNGRREGRRPGRAAPR